MVGQDGATVFTDNNRGEMVVIDDGSCFFDLRGLSMMQFL